MVKSSPDLYPVEVLPSMSALYSPERWRGHPTPLKLGRRDRRIIPAFQKNVLRDFLQLHEAHLHTENWGAERLMQVCADSAPAQCYSRSGTGEATAKSVLNLAHIKMASHKVVNKRQIRGITGAQTVIMKVSLGHMSCICTRSYLIAL